jgi:hypothetical protein
MLRYVALLCLVACYDASKPLPPYTPVVPVATADDCVRACAQLAALGCPEGSGSLGGEPCSVTCQRASELRPLPLACWASARSSAEAKACGSLRCVR